MNGNPVLAAVPAAQLVSGVCGMGLAVAVLGLSRP